MLTAVAGRSSVAAAGAVTVEGAPRLSAPPAVFTVTWRAPERERDRDRQWQSLSRKKDLSRKVSQGETSSLQRSRLHRRAGVWEKTQTESAFKNKREASVFEKKNITSRVPMSRRAKALVVKSKSLL